MTAQEQFGANVRQLRLAKRISQEELAFQSGLHRTYVGGVERGERNVSLMNIVKIATALKCDICDLFQEISLEA